jgi:hypothetical protein
VPADAPDPLWLLDRGARRDVLELAERRASETYHDALGDLDEPGRALVGQILAQRVDWPDAQTLEADDRRWPG